MKIALIWIFLSVRWWFLNRVIVYARYVTDNYVRPHDYLFLMKRPSDSAPFWQLRLFGFPAAVIITMITQSPISGTPANSTLLDIFILPTNLKCSYWEVTCTKRSLTAVLSFRLRCTRDWSQMAFNLYIGTEEVRAIYSHNLIGRIIYCFGWHWPWFVSHHEDTGDIHCAIELHWVKRLQIYKVLSSMRLIIGCQSS